MHREMNLKCLKSTFDPWFYLESLENDVLVARINFDGERVFARSEVLTTAQIGFHRDEERWGWVQVMNYSAEEIMNRYKAAVEKPENLRLTLYSVND